MRALRIACVEALVILKPFSCRPGLDPGSKYVLIKWIPDQVRDDKLRISRTDYKIILTQRL